MNKWVSVSTANGVAIYTMQLSSDSDTPGHVDGQEFIRVDFDTPDSALIDSYYNFDTKEFVPLPQKPNENYDFDGKAKQWKFNAQRASDTAIAQRSQLLYQSDWTQLPDAPVDREAWATYRQALRDITTQPDYPQTIVWPTAPAV